LDKQLTITVITRGDDLEQHVPGGFQYVDQMFEEAGLRDTVSADQTKDFWRKLRILRRALGREFGRSVNMRVLSPWTLSGLWFIVRHRLRNFPCIVIAGRRYPFDTPPGEIVEAVRQSL
jgi:hypothetical protein